MLPQLENSVRQFERQAAPAMERELTALEADYARQRRRLEAFLREADSDDRRH